MSARTDKLELEIKISELQDSLITCRSQLRLAEMDCVKVEAKITTAKNKLKHHSNNRSHVRSTADLVDLEEYKATLQSIKHLEVEIDSLQYEEAVYTKNRSTLVEHINETEAAIERKRALLRDYGLVIDFPIK